MLSDLGKADGGLRDQFEARFSEKYFMPQNFESFEEKSIPGFVVCWPFQRYANCVDY